MIRKLFAGVCLTGLVAVGCTSSPSSNTSSQPARPTKAPVSTSGSGGTGFDPTNFAGSAIDNTYFPLSPGSKYVYKGVRNGAGQRDVFVVTGQTKNIEGVSSTVIKDTATVLASGQVIEITSDWFAQDNQGNVWYMGEDTKEYDANGNVKSTAGSWTGGVDGAEPGIVMPANPQIPSTYKQEYYPGQAEDMAWFISLSQSATVPYQTYHGNLLQTLEWSPLETAVIEKKYYAAGVGLVYSVSAAGETETAKLVSFTHA